MIHLITLAFAAVAPLALISPAQAQTTSAHQAYAPLTDRAIKSLSEQHIADLRAGRGMGLALPAELNGYPGPLHALEHADALALTPEQLERIKALFDAMKAEAVLLGEQLIQQEIQLDRLFATRAVQSASLDAATSAIGTTQGQLRATHLRYHVAMTDLLTPEQVRRYGAVRGYGSGGAEPGRTPHGHGQHGRGAHRP